jgi:hypothetical protein
LNHLVAAPSFHSGSASYPCGHSLPHLPTIHPQGLQEAFLSSEQHHEKIWISSIRSLPFQPIHVSFASAYLFSQALSAEFGSMYLGFHWSCPAILPGKEYIHEGPIFYGNRSKLASFLSSSQHSNY